MKASAEIKARSRRFRWQTAQQVGALAGVDRTMKFPSFDPRLAKTLAPNPEYARLAAFALALARLQEEEVDGAIAEVGVWRGDSSVVLHAAAPDRLLHLFDTFEGFPQDQLDSAGGDARFRDTSETAVRGRLPAAANVRMHPGIVPDTLAQVEDVDFAFVLLDLDLSKPTTAALEFFYPRLAKGGYVFLHDYNNDESEWAGRRSLDGFLADKPEQLIELADPWGSAVFRKQ